MPLLYGIARGDCLYLFCFCASLPHMSIMSRIVTGDGIDITSSQDVEVKNCFIRSTDDSICIKSQRLFEDPSTVRDVTKVRVHNNVIWNAEPGNAIELGYALQSEIHDLVSVSYTHLTLPTIYSV